MAEHRLCCECCPARCLRDRDREVLNKPLPLRLSTSLSDFQCVQEGQAAGLGAEWAPCRQHPSSMGHGAERGTIELRSWFASKQPP